MGWLTYRLSGSAWLLGVVAFCANICILVLGTVRRRARRPRRPAARPLSSPRRCCALQATTLAVLTWFGWVEVWHLIALATWLGVVAAFDVPLRQTLYVQPGRRSRRSAQRDRAQLVHGQRGARRRPGARRRCCSRSPARPSASRSMRVSFVAVLAASRSVRWPKTGRPATRGGLLDNWIEGARYAFGFAPIRSVLLLVAVAGVDDQPVLVADADLRQGHLRRRPAHAGLAAVGGGRGRAGVDGLSRRARHDRRPGARHRAGRRHRGPRARRVRVPARASARRCC